MLSECTSLCWTDECMCYGYVCGAPSICDPVGAARSTILKDTYFETRSSLKRDESMDRNGKLVLLRWPCFGIVRQISTYLTSTEISSEYIMKKFVALVHYLSVVRWWARDKGGLWRSCSKPSVYPLKVKTVIIVVINFKFQPWSHIRFSQKRKKVHFDTWQVWTMFTVLRLSCIAGEVN